MNGVGKKSCRGEGGLLVPLLFVEKKSGGRDLELKMIWIETTFRYEESGRWIHSWLFGEYRLRDASEPRYRGT